VSEKPTDGAQDDDIDVADCAVTMEEARGVIRRQQARLNAQAVWIAELKAHLKWGDRRKPPMNRNGTTRKMPMGRSAIYVTVNRWADGDRGICELWAKADDGLQGEADGLCESGSVALQYGCPADVLVRHWYGHGERRIKQPWSVRDALAFALAAEAGIDLERHVGCEVVAGG
jgi:hypothetical protein